MIKPKGYLIAIGGAEDKGIQVKKTGSQHAFQQKGTLRSLTDLVATYAAPRIEIVSTASSFPEKMANDYTSAFEKLGCNHIGHLDIRAKEQADSRETLDRLSNANCIFFTGGDQKKLCSIIKGTSFLEILKDRYQQETFFIAGSSAGAAAMSHIMITGGNPVKSYKKGHVKLCTGFGLAPEMVIDTHFDQRGRIARLLQTVANYPGLVGIGLSEDTGIIIKQGHILQTVGSGTVLLIESNNLSYNNFHQLDDNTPFTLGNVLLHTLSHADRFDLHTRKLQPIAMDASALLQPDQLIANTPINETLIRQPSVA